MAKNAEKQRVKAVRKDENGIITDIKLEDGTELTKEEAIDLAKKDGIEGVNVGMTRGDDPQEMLRANPTDDPDKALNNLPEF